MSAAALKNARVTVMGLGRFGGGVGAVRWLCAQGARVLVTDMAPAGDLSESLREIEALPVELRLGGHDERDFRDADLVVVNPAVREDSPYLAAARQAGTPITTEINLFVERRPQRAVGVTGSVGKSTTTAMIGHVLERTLSGRRVWTGGNLGGSLLGALTEIKADDVVVLELSSFQLARIAAVSWSPAVAVVTGISPNHVDWHGDFEAYCDAKMNIVRFQGDGASLVLRDDEALAQRVARVAGGRDAWSYGLDGLTPVARLGRLGSPLASRSLRWDEAALSVPGHHNLENAAAALTVAEILGVDAAGATAALRSFQSLPDRMELIATIDGVRYYNDSKATTPAASITAMRSIEPPMLLILGGYDKGIDMAPAARHAATCARYVACIGQTGPSIAAAVRAAGGEADTHPDLESAVMACRRRAQACDSVVLSPGCASFGMFTNYRARGDAFRRIVRAAEAVRTEVGSP